VHRSALRRAAAALIAAGALFAAAGCQAADPGVPDEVLDLNQAAALLRVQPEALRGLAEAQRVPARRIGDTWRFSRSALVEWLKGDRAQAAPASEPGAPPAAVGERPAVPTAAEVALRDQRLLLRRREALLDLGVAYSRSEQTLFQVVRTEQRTITANAALRYGMADDLQLTLRVPAVGRRTETFSDASLTGTTTPRVSSDKYIGDASVSLLGVAWREAVGRPNAIWSLDAVVPTGPGDRGLGGGLVLSKSYDPAVIFAGLNYLHGFSVDRADPRRSLAKHNLGASFGYIYALNDALALSTVLSGSYRNARSPDEISIPPARERYQLQLGMTWLVARGLFLEPAVAMRLGGASPDVTLLLNLTLPL
jgi:excisionase family DNA binding protein